MRRVVDELIEDALRELADELYQRQLWLAFEGPEVSSLAECISRLWDDSGLAAALESDEEVYNPVIDDRLRRLDAILGRIDPSRAPESILEDPQLARARPLARSLLEDLRRFGQDDKT